MMFETLLLAATLAAAPASPSPSLRSTGRIPVLIVSGQGSHDWGWTSSTLRRALDESGKFKVEVTILPEGDLTDPDLSRYRVIVLDCEAQGGRRWGDRAEKNFLETVEGGTGVVALHGSPGAFPEWKEYGELLGGVWTAETRTGAFATVDIAFEGEHPLTDGLDDIVGHQDREVIGLSAAEKTGFDVLAMARPGGVTAGSGSPVLYTGSHGKGRVAVLPLGYVDLADRTTRSAYDEFFQQLILHSAEWAATETVTPMRRVEPNTLTDADRAAGWTLLFDGKSKKGWRSHRGEGFPEDQWKVENGVLKIGSSDERGTFAIEEGYSSFEIEIEWRVAEGTDLGLHYGLNPDGNGFVWHTVDPADEATKTIPAGMQVAEGRILRPAGEYNHARVVATEYEVVHWFNGIRIATFQMSASEWAEKARGVNVAKTPEFQRLPGVHIGLQDRGSDIWLRNAKIRQIPASEASARTPVPDARTVELFNGRDLSGWEKRWWVDNRPAGVWSVDDEGVLVCRGNVIGWLETTGSYTDYVLDLEWRYSPLSLATGEGGLLLRIGELDPDLTWPTSLEVQIMPNETGDLWTRGNFRVDPDRDRNNGHGTRRLLDAENRTGEWNRYVVRVEGGAVTVELNGQTVNRVSGATTAAGPIGLKSEGVEIHYRNIRLTPLD